jgi:hypothetical protein
VRSRKLLFCLVGAGDSNRRIDLRRWDGDQLLGGRDTGLASRRDVIPARRLRPLPERGGRLARLRMLFRMRLTTPRFSRQGAPPAIDDLYSGYLALRQGPPLQS